MSAVLAQIKLLINLAQIDGKVAEREQYHIINIARAHGFYPDEIEPLFGEYHEMIIPKDLTDEQKFNYIFSLVQLMKIDERMYKEEMLFCSKIATTLGYDQQIMFDLLLHVKATPMSKEDKASLYELTKKHIIKE